MKNVSQCRIRIKCHKCGYMMKVRLQQMADEEIIDCPCGQETQLLDFDGGIGRMIADECEEMELI